MLKITDAIGNGFFTDSSELATRVVTERDNPFIKVEKTDEYVRKEHILKDYADFCMYFY